MVEFQLGPNLRVLLRLSLTILINFIMCLLVLASIKVFEILANYLLGRDLVIFGLLPFHYLIDVMDAAVLLVFALSVVTTAARTLFRDPK